MVSTKLASLMARTKAALSVGLRLWTISLKMWRLGRGYSAVVRHRARQHRLAGTRRDETYTGITIVKAQLTSGRLGRKSSKKSCSIFTIRISSKIRTGLRPPLSRAPHMLMLTGCLA